jgi:hypothetical protein
VTALWVVCVGVVGVLSACGSLGAQPSPSRPFLDSPTRQEAEIAAGTIRFLHQDIGASPAVLDLRLLCPSADAEGCEDFILREVTALGLQPRVGDSHSYCVNSAPPCATGTEIMITVGAPAVAGQTATVDIQERRPRPSGEAIQVGSELVLRRAGAEWRVEQKILRWRS